MSRAFRGLRATPPRERYDAVIVGAGIGGLIAANLLAREGLEVLLVEQHYMAGGYCSTFRRGGYTFDASTHFYPLLGNPTTLTGRLLADLGVTTRWVKMDPVDTFHFPDGSRFDVPADLETYLAAVRRRFPEQTGNLERFFAAVHEAYVLGLLAYFRGRETPQLASYAGLTVRQVLDRHFDDERIKLLLTGDCPHWGSPPCRTSFLFDSMLRLSYFLGNYYPIGGSQHLADDLARLLEEAGGHILMSARVERIVIAGGTAVAVEAESLRGPTQGERYRVAAGVVLSNADLRQTVETLVGSEHFPPEYVSEVRRLRASFPCYLTHLGLTGVPADVLEQVQGYYWKLWDPDRVGRDALACKIFAPTLYDPGLAPEGGQIVILQKVIDLEYESIDDWPAHKAGVEDFVKAHFETVVPGVGKHVTVQLAASARTAWRFTSNLHGAMLGWEMSPDQLGAARPARETPIANLYLVGHWTQPGGGVTPVIVSAVRVVETILGTRQRAPGVSLLGAVTSGVATRQQRIEEA